MEAAAHRATHKTIAAVSNDLDRFHFNKAVAAFESLPTCWRAFSQTKQALDGYIGMVLKSWSGLLPL